MVEQTKLETIVTKIESIPSRIEEPNVNSIFIDRFQEYRVIEQLPSKGAESDIYIIQKNKRNYILKLYRLGIEPKKEILDALQQLSQKYHKDLVKIYDTGFDKSNKRWYEIQEYLEHGSLRDFKEEIELEKLYKIIEEILSILNTLHCNKIIHRDIKPENILIRSYEPLDLVITDFGISSLLDDVTNIWTTIQGSYRYFAPESFVGVIGKAVDYWSFGMIIYELANNRKHYFDAISNEATIQLHITTKEIEIPSYFDANIRRILGFLFRINPENRGDYQLIKKWLNREDIGEPKTNEKVIENKDGYPFNGKKYNDFSALAKTVGQNYKNWSLWRDHLEKNHVIDWTINQKQYNKNILITNIKNSNKDLMVLKFIYTFNSNIQEFRLFGKVITLNNLHLFVQNYLNNSFVYEERKIYKALISGKIREYYHEYLQLTQSEDNYGLIFDEIAKYIKKSGEDGLSKRVIFKFLDFLNHQEEYLLPKNREEITIHNFNYFIKKKELTKIGILLDSISLDESQKLKKIILIKREDYYFPNDFFKNLEKNFSDTIFQVDFFIKKSNLLDIEKRYYIPHDSPYSQYIEDIKDRPANIYIQTYKKLIIFKKDKLLLKSELEKAKEQKELFLLFDINITRPLTCQLSKIKKILHSGIDIKTYQKIKSIKREKVDNDLNNYISTIEALNIPFTDEDKKIINFIINYRWKLYSLRVLFIVFVSSILIAIPFFKPYLFSFIIAFALFILSFIFLVNSVVKIDISLLKRIAKITQTDYKTKKELPHRLIIVDNILLKYTFFLLSLWLLYHVIPIFILLIQLMGGALLDVLTIGALHK